MSVKSRSYPLLALSYVLGVGMLAAQEPEPRKPASRTTRQIEGWTVRVDDRLPAPPHDVLDARVLRLLEAKLTDITYVVPKERMEKLQAVTIVLDLTHGKLRAMQYHPDAGGLEEHGYARDLVKCVHQTKSRELIRDPHFRTGFRLIEPKPGQRVVYGRLAGSAGDTEPAWDLDQWSSRFPLVAETPVVPQPGVRRWANAAKVVTVGAADTAEADLFLAVNATVEYGKRARKSGSEPWVHLLVEQYFADPPSLTALTSARLRLKARLLQSEFLRTDEYSPGLHAAQFQLFLMLQNRNRQSPGFGKLVWFGIPIYDDRSQFPKEHKAQDFGGTAMFIFTPGGEVFADRSAHDRDWITIDKDLRPLLVESLETAWQRGFLRESRDLADYRITGMNLGWEVPGLFDVAVQVRDLSLEVELVD